MKPLTQEWIEKADADYTTMLREARARKRPNYDDVCYHGQQCVEKYLKGALVESGVSFPKTHDLIALLDLNLPLHPDWKRLEEELGVLNEFGVRFRYPGENADQKSAKTVVKYCRTVREAIRHTLGLDESLLL
jgi:HEPN domain-containing protein